MHGMGLNVSTTVYASPPEITMPYHGWSKVHELQMKQKVLDTDFLEIPFKFFLLDVVIRNA
jgi:hypothetical protein